MGMFDVIEFPKPIKCIKCGQDIKDTQTKQFENLMITYYIGDILPGNFINGIMAETLYCNHGNKENRENMSYDQEIFLVIWHKILIEIAETMEEAEKKLSSFSIGDLYLLYENLFLEKSNFMIKYRKLKSSFKLYLKYLNLSKEEQEKVKNNNLDSFKKIHWFSIREALKSENPLEEIIKEIDKSTFRKEHMF